MKYLISPKYNIPELHAKMMGPNPIELQEEMLLGHKIPAGGIVCDLGSGQGVTSLVLAQDYGFTAYAADLWSEPQENQEFFDRMGVPQGRIIPVKADAACLPFEKDFFDAVISTDAYNYWGRDPEYLDAKLLPFVKKGGYVYACVPGMKKDCHDNLPRELLIAWTPEELAYLRDMNYWSGILNQCKDAKVLSLYEMKCHENIWDVWLRQDIAAKDKEAMEAGAGKYINFIAFALQKNN